MEEEKYGYIYLTENLINGKKYIGQHRAQEFEPNRYIGSGKFLSEAISKYGKENFKCSILEWCYSESQLNEREIYWISFYNAVEDSNFYNILKGGEGGLGRSKGFKHSEATRLKMCGKIRTPIWTLRQSLSRKGKKKSPEWANKISQSRTGIKYSKETRESIKKYRRQRLGKAVICIETQEIFSSISEASETYKGDIESCCNKRQKTSCGYHWSFIDDEENLKFLNQYIGKPKSPVQGSKIPVVCLETGEVLESAAVASRKYHCDVSAQIAGKQKTANGWHWKVLEE